MKTPFLSAVPGRLPRPFGDLKTERIVEAGSGERVARVQGLYYLIILYNI